MITVSIKETREGTLEFETEAEYLRMGSRWRRP
jgi:hypothetical protein